MNKSYIGGNLRARKESRQLSPNHPNEPILPTRNATLEFTNNSGPFYVTKAVRVINNSNPGLHVHSCSPLQVPRRSNLFTGHTNTFWKFTEIRFFRGRVCVDQRLSINSCKRSVSLNQHCGPTKGVDVLGKPFRT